MCPKVVRRALRAKLQIFYVNVRFPYVLTTPEGCWEAKIQSPKHGTFAELSLAIFQNTELTVEVLFQKEFGDPNTKHKRNCKKVGTPKKDGEH